jgi:ABC-type nickel/cobalt efflux system permease component RcnA
MKKGIRFIIVAFVFVFVYTLCLELVSAPNTLANLGGLIIGFCAIWLTWKEVGRIFKKEKKNEE